MDDFIPLYATKLRAGLAGPVDMVDVADVALTAEEEDAVLELARVVAHGTERKNAPLASYITGLLVADRGRTGDERLRALQQALHVARTLLGDEGESAG